MSRRSAAGCQSTQSMDIVTHLKSLSVEEILQHITPMERFSPVIDNNVLTTDDVARGRRIASEDVDVMVGCNNHEGAIMAMFFTQYKFPDVESVKAAMKQLVLSTFDPETTDIEGMIEAMIDEHCGDASSEEALAHGWVEWASDFLFTYATVTTANAHAGLWKL